MAFSNSVSISVAVVWLFPLTDFLNSFILALIPLSISMPFLMLSFSCLSLFNRLVSRHPWAIGAVGGSGWPLVCLTGVLGVVFISLNRSAFSSSLHGCGLVDCNFTQCLGCLVFPGHFTMTLWWGLLKGLNLYE